MFVTFRYDICVLLTKLEARKIKTIFLKIIAYFRWKINNERLINTDKGLTYSLLNMYNERLINTDTALTYSLLNMYNECLMNTDTALTYSLLLLLLLFWSPLCKAGRE